MDNNQEVNDRSGVDNFSFGVVVLGLLTGAIGVVLTSTGIAITGGVLLTLGLSYFGLKQMLAD